MTDFGIPETEFSEEMGGKTLRLKSKDLSAFFWSRMDVVNRYHTYEDGDSSSSFEEVDISDNDDNDSYDWIGGNDRYVTSAKVLQSRTALFDEKYISLELLMCFFWVL